MAGAARFLRLILPAHFFPAQIPPIVPQFGYPLPPASVVATEPAAMLANLSTSQVPSSAATPTGQEWAELLTLDALSVFFSAMATMIALIALMAALQNTQSVASKIDTCNEHLSSVRVHLQQRHRTSRRKRKRRRHTAQQHHAHRRRRQKTTSQVQTVLQPSKYYAH